MSDDGFGEVYAGAILLAEQRLLRAAYPTAWNEPYRRWHDAYVAATGRTIPPLSDDATAKAQADEARLTAYMAAARESRPFIAPALRAAASAIPENAEDDLTSAARATAEVLANYVERMTDAVLAEQRKEEVRPRGIRRLVRGSGQMEVAERRAARERTRAADALNDLAVVAHECSDKGIALDVLSVLALALRDESRRRQDGSEADRIAAMAQTLDDQRDSVLSFVAIASDTLVS